jgi:hypothetical protein
MLAVTRALHSSASSPPIQTQQSTGGEASQSLAEPPDATHGNILTRRWVSSEVSNGHSSLTCRWVEAEIDG